MSFYIVSRQRMNCGPVQEITTDSLGEAERAFDIAVADNDVFVEIFDYDQQCQLMVYHAPLVWC